MNEKMYQVLEGLLPYLGKSFFKGVEYKFQPRSKKGGELLEHPNVKPRAISSRALRILNTVEEKVQRLTGEDQETNKPDTSTAPEREDIVWAAQKCAEVGD